MRKAAILLGLPFIVFLLEIVLPGAGPFQQSPGGGTRTNRAYSANGCRTGHRLQLGGTRKID
jgi:hypothetical protein